MILSKDSDTLNLTTSILSAKSMLQTKLDGIGIDVKNIENALNTLQNEIIQLKAEVEKSKEELVTTAEELKDTTDNERIKHLIDEVQTTVDGIEINDDILEGLCLSSCNMNDDTCFLNVLCNVVQDGSTGCTECYGYTEGVVTCRPTFHVCNEEGYDTGCPADWDSYCSSCYENGFDENCGQDYVDCSNGYCHAGFSDSGWCGSEHSDGSRDCPTEFKNDCIGRFVTYIDGDKGGVTCLLKYVATGLSCDNMYKEGEDEVTCTQGYNDHGNICKRDHYVSIDYITCSGGYTYPDGEHCDGDYNYTVGGGCSCSSDYGDGKIDCESGYSVDETGIVSCESGHSGDDGSCEGGHTWKDDIGGSCEGIFHNSTMNCQGGVAQDKTEERLTCNVDYESGNINCNGGYAEDVDDQVVFCPNDFNDGYTTCKNGYMKQNGTETCTNKDPISCRGGCVSGYCDYCGGCVGSCDSCRGCHGAGNCDFRVCNECHGTTVTYPCGAQACGDNYEYCVAHNYGISWN